ncbi:VWA domain-containing protein [Candidatus Kapabacteria bacterium]|nr:VWA domain-containing protein [Candidatus Kapabacteria bacterium]
MYKILFLLIFILNPIFAQELILIDFSQDNFPELEAKFLIIDENNSLDFNDNVEIFYRGNLVESTTDCPELNSKIDISSVLTIDVSNSMRGERLTLAKQAAKEWINLLDFPNSECAITSFSDNSYVVTDFTADKDKLLKGINSLIPVGGTSYENGIYGQKTSATNLVLSATEKPIIVFLTDGTSDFEFDNALAEIQKSGATFFAISLQNPMPDKLKQFSIQTGGIFFEDVKTEKEMKAVYRAINFLSTGGEPCSVKWESTGCDIKRNYQMISSKYDLEKDFEIIIDPNQLPKILYSDDVPFDHGIIAPQDESITTIEITASGDDISIDGISVSNQYFEIIDWGGTPPPFTLSPGETRTITTRFKPTNNQFQFASFRFESNACNGIFFYQTGGDKNLIGEGRTIKLVQPNGDERFEVGSNQEIKWEGILENEKVCIQYSTDNGDSWININEGNGNLYEWNNIPDTPSENCLARITIISDGFSAITKKITTDGSVIESKSRRGLGFMKSDGLGNIYFSGYYIKELGIETNTLSNPDNTKNNIFIAKFSPDLDLIWVKDIETDEDCSIGLRAMTVDLLGNVIIGGHFRGGTIFSESGSPLTSDNLTYKFFIMKFDPDGTETMANLSGGSIPMQETNNENLKETTIETIQSITTDELGFIYIAGVTVDYFSYQNIREKVDQNLNDQKNTEFFIAKLDPNLNYVSHIFTDGIRPEIGYLTYNSGKLAYGINYVANGSIIDSDRSSEEIPNSQNVDILIAEFNNNLQLQNSFVITGQDRVMIADLEYSPDNSLNIFGTFVRTIRFPNDEIINSPTPDLSTDLFLSKIIPNGNSPLWTKTFGSNVNQFGNENAKSMDIDNSGNILVTGTYVSEFIFEDVTFENPNNSINIFTMQFDITGNLTYTSAPNIYQNVNTAAPYDIEFIENGYLFSGYFANQLFEEPNTLTEEGGLGDIFISKFGFEKSTSCNNFSENPVFDISDNIWEIYKSSDQDLDISIIDQVDMGVVEVGSTSEKVIDEFIINNSSPILNLNSVSFINSDRFDIVAGNPPNKIEGNSSLNTEFSFSPNQTGYFEADIIFKTNSGDLKSKIFGNGVNSSINQLTNPIDFGRVEILTNGKTLVSDILKNNGINVLGIDEALIIGPDIEQFNLNNISTNLLQANEILNSNITFAPSLIGKTSSILALVNSSSSKTWFVDLYGEGIKIDSARFRIYTNKIEDETGNEVLIPIYIDGVDELIARSVDTVHTELTFNESLIYPLDNSNIGTTYGRKRTIPLAIPLESNSGNLVMTLTFLATLGDEQATILDIQNTYPVDNGGNVITSSNFDEEDGEFRLSDICWDGGGRFVTGTGKYTLNIQPNPVKKEVLVSFGIIETSKVQISIYSIDGQLIKEIFNQDLEYGFYEENFEFDLENGNYILVIDTISGRKSIKFNVFN